MILITGGMGFIGLHTARSLLDLGEQVVITRFRTTRLPSFLADEVGKGLTVVPLDLSDPQAAKQVLVEQQIRSIVHLAVPARTNLTAIQEMVGSTGATLGLMSAAIEAGIERITAASSLAVYMSSIGEGVPLTEDMNLPLTASHPIEANKKIDEIIGSFLTATGALRVVRARISSIWGPAYHSMMNAPSRLAMLALGRADRIAGRPDPLDAHPDDMMDLLYARDCGRALAMLHVAPSLPHDVYNVTAGSMVRYGDLVAEINRAVPGATLALRPVARAPIGRIDGYCANDRLREDAGVVPQFDLRTATTDYIEWLRANPE